MSSIPYIKTATGLSFVFKGRSKIIPFDHVNFQKINDAVVAGLTDVLEDLFDLKAFIEKVSDGKVKISEDEVRVDGVKAPTYLATRILENVRDGEPISAICRFTEKVMTNPNSEIVEDLFRWLEKGNMPIYDDGDFLAYKKVRADYTAIHPSPDGTSMLQAIGSVVEMNRADCDSNRGRTCSTGLHFCSYDYLNHFGTGGESKIIILKINPKDVVAIPADYNDTKGRTCRFEVVGEVPEEDAKEFFGNSVVSSFGTYNPPAANDTETKSDVAAEIAAYEKAGSYAAAARLLGIGVKTFKKRYKKAVAAAEAAAQENEQTFKTSDGTVIGASRIRHEVETNGPTEAARNLGVARSTLYSWYNKILLATAA